MEKILKPYLCDDLIFEVQKYARVKNPEVIETINGCVNKWPGQSLHIYPDDWEDDVLDLQAYRACIGIRLGRPRDRLGCYYHYWEWKDWS